MSEISNLSSANQVYIANTKKCDNTQNPIKEVKAEENNQSGNKKLKNTLICLGIAGTAIVAGALIFKGHADKAKKMAEEAQKIKQNNLTEIFEKVECSLPTEGGERTKMTFGNFLDKYLHSVDCDGQKFFHGTGYNTAQKIQADGTVKKGFRGGTWTKNFIGSFFTQDEEVATKYAKQVASIGSTHSSILHPIEETSGAVVTMSLAPGSKLAKFTDSKDKFLDWDFIGNIMEDADFEKALKNKDLDFDDFIEFLQENLKKRGFSGIQTYDCHTGVTDIIFDGTKMNIENIVQI